ncbi:NUDIX hydrolase [Thiocapsa marina]|uniref:NUDIX hydrolase n=1 Tax=Thiocapsa marina 5811 TaxID=768671 RepID=F9UHQ3_9GAMM|nr:NUDIX domain-containing protein [Thiocapsa marina]EGV16229.1 NUDIX hydrolase [Thiocapsa marina 5811]
MEPVSKYAAKTAFPVPIVRMIVTDDRERVLILRRDGTGHAHGEWCLPGGKVDYGVTVEQAVRDELREETGLDCLAAEFLFYQDSPPSESGEMHCINLYFVCRTAGEMKINHESSASAWIARDQPDAPALVFGNDAALGRYWASVDAERGPAPCAHPDAGDRPSGWT